MLKSSIKRCMLTAAGLMLSLSALAAEPEVSVSGAIYGIAVNHIEVSGTNHNGYLDMEAEADIEVSGKMTSGDWEGSGAALFYYNEADGFTADSHWVTLENPTLSFSLGYYNPEHADVTLGKDYFNVLLLDQSLFIGDAPFYDAGDGLFKIGIKDAGLELSLGANSVDDGGENYDSELASLYYSGEFGDLAISARATGVWESIDKNNAPTLENGDHDDGWKKDFALAIGYKIGGMYLSVAGNEYTVQKGGHPEPDLEVTSNRAVAFDLPLTDNSGISFSYGYTYQNDGANSDVIDVDYLISIAGVDISVVYSVASADVDDDKDMDEASYIIGGGMTYSF